MQDAYGQQRQETEDSSAWLFAASAEQTPRSVGTDSQVGRPLKKGAGLVRHGPHEHKRPVKSKSKT
jgi:hypothetical protein